MVFCHNIFVSPSQDFFTCVEKTTLPLKDFILDIYSSVTAFGQWEFFSLSHRMWHIMWKFHVQICQHLQIQFAKKKKIKECFVCSIVCLGFFVPLKKFSLIWTHRHWFNISFYSPECFILFVTPNQDKFRICSKDRHKIKNISA